MNVASSVLDPNDHGSAGVTGRAPSEQADPAAAQPQRVEQLDDEPGTCRPLRVPVHQAASVGIHPLQRNPGLPAEPQVVDRERIMRSNRVHVTEAEPGAVECSHRRRNRSLDRARLALAQRRMARTQKGSANRDKARLKVARVHARITDRRRDFLHKLTTRLVRDNQAVVIEDLKVRNMVRNHHLARAISDVAWREIRGMLEYKCEWYGRDLIVIDRWYPSSKTCSGCEHYAGPIPLNVREWECVNCGTRHDRDINAAVNIRAAGLAVLACGAGVRPQRESSRAGGRQ